MLLHCSPAQLRELALNNLEDATSPLNQNSDRVLRPMILTKQLDLPEGYGPGSHNVSPQTPRTNLAKELEKYNRPPSEQQASFKTLISPKVKEAISAPDRPNILLKKPHYKPQYRYDPIGPINLSTRTEVSQALPSIEVETLDLSMKHTAEPSSPQLSVDEQQEPMDFTKKTLDSCPEEPMDMELSLHSHLTCDTMQSGQLNMDLMSESLMSRELSQIHERPHHLSLEKEEMSRRSPCMSEVSMVEEGVEERTLSTPSPVAVNGTPPAGPVTPPPSSPPGLSAPSPTDCLNNTCLSLSADGMDGMMTPPRSGSPSPSKTPPGEQSMGYDGRCYTPDIYQNMPGTPSTPGTPRDREPMCPTPGCRGLGHISGNYATHRSLSGCPLVDRAMIQATSMDIKCPTPGCDGSGHVTGNYASHRSLSGCPRANKPKKSPMKEGEGPEPLRCPVVGCDGSGHVTGKYLSHRSASGCPLANRHRALRNLSLVNGVPEFSTILNRPSRMEPTNCPTPGCDGSDHVNGTFTTHRGISGCPLATSAMKKAKLSFDDLPTIQEAAAAGLDNNPELLALEQEISNMERDNTSTEETVNRLHSDVNTLETQAQWQQQENQALQDKAGGLQQHVHELKETLLTRLQHIQMPASEGPLSEDNLFGFLTKLQRLCVHEEQVSPEHAALRSAVKQALQGIHVS